MNDIERRTLLSAAGIGAIAALAKAGPLDPPAGAVAPSGRTLDEVYNKIPTAASNGAFEGRTAIPGGSSPVLINQPGSYVLTGNITATGGVHALEINASNVTVDLNGFTVTADNNVSGAVGIQIGNAPATIGNIVVRNGRVSGGLTGIYVYPLVSGALIEDVTIRGSRATGIGSGGNSLRIRRCSLFEIGANLPPFVTNIIISGMNLGDASTVEDCLVSRMAVTGAPPSGTVNGIRVLGDGNFVARCTVAQKTSTTGIGFLLSGTGIYRDNSAIYFTTLYGGGGWGNGGGNV